MTREGVTAGTDPGGVLVVGAHAFDAEVMAGSACAVYADAGRRVVLLHLSLGELGHRSLSPAEYAPQKRREAMAAAAILGAEVLSFDYPDGGVPTNDAVAQRVARVIREVKPEIVIGHWRGSWHKDHVAAHHAMVQGVFYAALPTFEGDLRAHAPQQILFGENWEDDEGFRPEVYVDTSSGHERWRAALRAYALGRGELGDFRYFDYYDSLAQLRGCLAGVSRAEAFMRSPRSVLVGLGQFVVNSGDEHRR
jgi:N-acetylglucosamine malate deacetylase 1